MAKRTAALLAVLVTLWPTPAHASTPLWACTVPVSIEPGPHATAATVAVHQLDDATRISWPIVESGALVTIEWSDTEKGAYAWSVQTDTEYVEGGVVLGWDVPNRSVMTGLLHELGHIAGLPHNDEERSVMNATVQWRKFQPVDLEALGAVGCSG